jgi:hypothetical protein
MYYTMSMSVRSIELRNESLPAVQILYFVLGNLSSLLPKHFDRVQHGRNNFIPQSILATATEEFQIVA